MTLPKLFALALCCCALAVHAQDESSVWIFGPEGTGLDFSGCEPEVFSAGFDGFYDLMFEGSTAVTDFEGNLLFFTNGERVYNADYQLMPGGLLSGGIFSFTQTLIVRQPGSNSLYYLFYPEAQLTNDAGNLFYAEIDMSLFSGSGGVLSSGNILVEQTDADMTEKIVGVPHVNGVDTWVVTHELGTNCFRSYRVATSGLVTTPVISCVGPTVENPSGTSNGNALGELKASPDQSKLAFTSWEDGTSALFQFDNSTGVVSDPIPLDITVEADYNTSGYGVSFSPGGSKLYISANTPLNLFGSATTTLNQFDLTTWEPEAIQASRTLIHEAGANGRLFSLKIGPDGKVYCGRTGSSEYLGVINEPDAPGETCAFEFNGLYLDGYTSTWGLNNQPEPKDVCTPTAQDSTGGTDTSLPDLWLPAQRVFPTPATDFVALTLPWERLSLYNTTGALVLETRFRERIDISALPAGAYTAVVDGAAYRVVKQ